MLGRSKSRRIWFALLYGLATIVAHGLHDHGVHRDGPEAVALPGCDDPLPHYSGHAAPELIPGDLLCPACQFRAEHQAETSRPTVIPVVVRRLGDFSGTPPAHPASESRPSARAPPLA